jgi:hypothetical protein
MRPTLILLALLALAPAAFADGTQLYKWTDAQGVVHYSDKPPAQPAADLSTTAMPSFPVQDPAVLAAKQAALDAQAQTAQKLLQIQLDQQAEARRHAEVQAELAAAEQQPDPGMAAEPIYVDSRFVPRAYRKNLYVQHRSGSHPSHPQPVQPAHTILPKPH